MTEVIINPAPGINLSESYYAGGKNNAYVTEGVAFRQGQNRWDNASNVEWIAGYPQKIAGWSQATSTVLTDPPRASIVWRDNQGNAQVAIGTSSHLYAMTGSTVTDITPVRILTTGSLTGVISTSINSQNVVIADTSAQVAVGDWVYLSAASAVGGIQPNGWYYVNATTPGTNYTITFPSPATSTAGPGGGSISYQYPRVTLSGPFTTTNGSATVTVAHTAHSAEAGNYVDFSGASAVAGLTIIGEYQIANIVDANNYTITASSNANASTTGGGSVSVFYPVPQQQITYAAKVPYNSGAYGVGSYSASGTSVAPELYTGWTLAAYGYQLLSCPVGGTIYVYDPSLGGRSYPLLNAPTSMNAMFITPERFVVAVGVSNTMQIAWADQNDYTAWTTSPTNTAETGRTIVGGSHLVGGIAVRPGQSLIFSDRCVFSMQYAGGAYIYTTAQAGDNCGLIAPNAVCVEGGVAYWMSDYDFWTWNGTATALSTDDIRESVFGPNNLNRLQTTKAIAVLNRQKRQVRFYYATGAAAENNVGILYQYDQQCWGPLSFGRSAATDANLLSTPVSCDANGIVYFDETGSDANGSPLPWSLQLGMMDISNGDRNIDIFGFTPDFLYLSGNPQLTILTQYYPTQPIVIDGPYTLNSMTTRQDLRSDGKLFAFALSDNELGSNFRLGLPRVDISPAGARR